MKLKISFILLILTLAVSYGYAKPQFGKSELFNENWKFQLADTKDCASETLDDLQWRQLSLPHDWSVEGVYSPDKASCQGFLPGGIGWYRKTFNIGKTNSDKKIYAYFEGVYNRSEVYLNGKLLGKRPNGYVSFMYDLTPYIHFDKPNILAVKADHSRTADSRWYTGSGIYRDVYLVYANPLHINNWGVYAYPTVAEKDKGVLEVEVELKNTFTQGQTAVVIHELLAPDGTVKATSKTKIKVKPNEIAQLNNSLSVNNPSLWSLEQPALYKLVTKVFVNSKLVDESTTTTGFRKLTFDPNKGFALNNKWMKVKGVCLHHDAGVLGASVYREVWKRRLLTLKELGVNAVRTSHNPQSAFFYETCDEIGLLVLNEAYDEWEFPKRKWLEGWNVGTPGFEGSYDFFAEWGEKDLEDMVRRDRNHISVFAWSIGNEVDYPNDPYSHPVLDGGDINGFTQAIYGGYKKDAPDAMRLGIIAKRLAAAVKRFDKSRPVTAGMAGVAMSNQTGYPGALDITGYNYTESMYQTDNQKYPERVIFGSENRHDIDAWKAVTDNEFIFGQFLWTGIDYLGESGPWPSRGFYSGLVDFGSFVKPRGFFRQSLWTEKPMAYIGTYPIENAEKLSTDVLSQFEANNANNEKLSMDAWPVWNYSENQLIRVVAYTNVAKAHLLLDGREVGKTKPYDKNTGIIYWDIPYAKGKLEIVGMNSENLPICRFSIQSSERPQALTAISDLTLINKNRGLAQVVVQVVDKDSIPVMISEDEITCTIDGPAKLLGLEASNNSDMSNYSVNVHRAYHGRLLAYIQATGNAGAITVKFTAPWLKDAKVIIKAID
jgi:beta-galactosidase/beta-glucuronidase